MANGAPTVSNGLVISGVTTSTNVSVASSVTATTYYGSGANLTNITQTTINNNADNRVITGSNTSNTLEGESNVVINGGKLGIGVASPAQLIEVHGASNPAVLVQDTTNNCISYMYSQDSVATFGSASNHPVVFNVSNGEKARIDTSGNLLIGTTTAGTGSGDDLTISNSSNMGLTLRSTSSNYCNIYFSDATSGTAEYEGYISYNHATDSLEFATGHTERLRIDSNGDLGLGIAAVPQDSGARTLHIHDTTTGSAARAAIRLTHGSSGSSASNGAFLGFDNNPDFYIYNQESGKLRFGTAGTERYRITSDGKHQFGRPGAFQSDVDEDDFAFTFSSNAAATHPNTNNRDTDFVEAMQIVGPVRDSTNTPALVLKEAGGQMSGRQSLVFFNGDYNSGAGYIKSRIYTQVGASYNSTQFYIDVADSSKSPQQRFRIDTSGNFHGSSSNNISDQRLKKDIATITDPLTKIKGLTGRTFKWKEDSTKFDDKTKFGFIAQEVETILPELVNSDGLMHFDANDNICDEFEAISHSKSVVETGVIPITVEAIKILIAKVETLEAEVAALKAK